MNKKIQKEVEDRSQNKCELCGQEAIEILQVPAMDEEDGQSYVNLCSNCHQANESQDMEADKMRFLTDSMWSDVDGVKVLSYRMLRKINELWASEALDMLYMEDELKQIADAGNAEATHFDANGNPLQNGDKVVLTKTLDVKGANLKAPKGVVVHNIRLDENDPTHIIGKVDGQTIYIKTEFLKKN